MHIVRFEHNYVIGVVLCSRPEGVVRRGQSIPLLVVKVAGYSLQLRMRGVRLRFTVNSEMCVRLWRQFFIAELTSNRISDWISILRRKGQGGSKSFTEINILFVRYCAFYLPDLVKSEWLCGMNDHHSFFQRQRSEVAPSRSPVS